jgi:hypothetical protein
LGRAGQSRAPLSCAAQGRHASRVASARTLGSTTRRRAVFQQEVRLRRELEQPRRGGAARYRYAAALNQAHAAPESETRGAVSGSAPQARTGNRINQRLGGASREAWLGQRCRLQSVRRPTATGAIVASLSVGSGGGMMVAAAATRATARHWGRSHGMLWSMLPSRRRSAVLPNPSLNTRPREACHLGAAQGSRRLHCPARRQGVTPRGSPQLER